MEKSEQLYLELEDTQWPFTCTDHDRQVVRAVVIDDAGWYYLAGRCVTMNSANRL